MGIELTKAQLRILKVLNDHRGSQEPMYGGILMTLGRLSSGTVYRSLDVLEDAGLVVGTWEDIDETSAGRRARRYLEITAHGVQAYESEIALLTPARLIGANA